MMDNDWRLFREQEKYLHGVTLIKQSYKSNNPLNDHDHWRQSGDGSVIDG